MWISRYKWTLGVHLRLNWGQWYFFCHWLNKAGGRMNSWDAPIYTSPVLILQECSAILRIQNFIFCAGVFCLCVCLCITWIPDVLEDRKRVARLLSTGIMSVLGTEHEFYGKTSSAFYWWDTSPASMSILLPQCLRF